MEKEIDDHEKYIIEFICKKCRFYYYCDLTDDGCIIEIDYKNIGLINGIYKKIKKG